MKNYVNHIINSIINKARIDKSLYQYLFGDGIKGSSYTSNDIEPMLPALALKQIKTRIKGNINISFSRLLYVTNEMNVSFGHFIF
jgi:hypothetical protein